MTSDAGCISDACDRTALKAKPLALTDFKVVVNPNSCFTFLRVPNNTFKVDTTKSVDASLFSDHKRIIFGNWYSLNFEVQNNPFEYTNQFLSMDVVAFITNDVDSDDVNPVWV